MKNSHILLLALAALAVSSPTFAANADRAHFNFPDQATIVLWFQDEPVDKSLITTIAAGLAGQTISRLLLRDVVAALATKRSATTQPHRTERKDHGTKQADHRSIGAIIEILSRNGAPQPPQAAPMPEARKNTARKKR